ncbi:MAG: SAM-dependent methyltransferase [Salibacteraceae bacterium]
MSKGRLFLIPSSLGSDDPVNFIPKASLDEVYRLQYFIAERAKTARAYLKDIAFPLPMSDIHVNELNKHDREDYKQLLAPCLGGHDCGLLSEAGVPGVADPGGGVVAAAHRLGIEVVPLVGASSILLALMASGMSGQKFMFHGYLPKDETQLAKQIKTLESTSQNENMTQIFIETPFRNEKLRAALLRHLKADTRLCLSVNLTAKGQSIRTKTVADWKKATINIDRNPTVFLIYAGQEVK